MTFCLRASLLSESEQRRGKRRPSMACCAFKNNERQPPWARPPLVRRLCHCGLLPRHTPALSTWPPRSKANRNGWEPSPRPVPPSVPPQPLPSYLTCSSRPTSDTHPLLCCLWPPPPPEGALRPRGPQNLPWAPEA